MRIIIGYVIVVAITFGMFFWVPVLSRDILQIYNIKILGMELLLIFLPIIAVVGFYERDWFIGMFGLSASAGYFFGLRYVHKQKGK